MLSGFTSMPSGFTSAVLTGGTPTVGPASRKERQMLIRWDRSLRDTKLGQAKSGMGWEKTDLVKSPPYLKRGSAHFT